MHRRVQWITKWLLNLAVWTIPDHLQKTCSCYDFIEYFWLRTSELCDTYMRDSRVVSPRYVSHAAVRYGRTPQWFDVFLPLWSQTEVKMAFLFSGVTLILLGSCWHLQPRHEVLHTFVERLREALKKSNTGTAAYHRFLLLAWLCQNVLLLQQNGGNDLLMGTTATAQRIERVFFLFAWFGCKELVRSERFCIKKFFRITQFLKSRMFEHVGFWLKTRAVFVTDSANVIGFLLATSTGLYSYGFKTVKRQPHLSKICRHCVGLQPSLVWTSYSYDLTI